MKTLIRQSGAFILATVVFLMVVGAVLLYSMTNLSQISSTTASIEHNSHVASAAAYSALKHCIYQLDNGACTANPDISGFFCTITVADGGCNAAAAPFTCTITATAICPSGTLNPPDTSMRGAKKLSINVQKSAMIPVGVSYQMIPASLTTKPTL